MKLGVVVKNYFTSDDFRHPHDFFWLKIGNLRENFKAALFFHQVPVIIIYYAISILCMVVYYSLIPARLLQEYVKGWCE